MSRVPIQEDVGVAINRSLFSRVDENGTAEESMVDYLCIHEQDQNGQKTRWLFLAVSKFGKCMLHKGKQNSNGTFSKGKTWQLEDLRVLEQNSPSTFSLTFSTRSYQWRTDNARDLTEFLNNIARTYKSVTGELPRLINFNPSKSSSSSRPTPMEEQHSPHLAPGGLRPSQASQGLSPKPSHPHLHGRSPRTPTAALPVPGAAPPPPSSSSRISAARSPAMTSTTSLASSHQSFHSGGELAAPPRPHKASFSSDRSFGSQDGFERRPSAPTIPIPVSRDPRDMGLGVPPPTRRRGSADDRTAPPSPVSTGSKHSDPSSYRRPPSVSSIPSMQVAPRVQSIHEDPYGGMADDELHIPPAPAPAPAPASAAPEILTPPVPASRPDVLITPVVMEPEAEPEMVVRAPPTQSPSSASLKEGLATPSSGKSTEPSTPNLEGDTLAPPGTRRSPKLDSPINPQRRVSFHPPPLTTAYSRDVLLTSRPGKFGAIDNEDPEDAGDAIMANVEELIEGFDWTAVTTSGSDRSKGTDVIEGRLLDELAALESANIHAFLESDDRVDQVITHIDDALMELDDIDVQLAGYRMQLGVVTDDIDYIEGQNRGLQVQTSNQHALLNEIRQLLQITDVPREDLAKLSQISPSTQRGVEELEQAAASLYKAIQTSREGNEVAATNKHMREYRDAATVFSTRVLEYLDIAFKHQSASTLSDFRKSREVKLRPHTAMGENLMMYEGLVLFVKDMDDERYKRLCTNYITTISGLHQSEMTDLLASLQKKVITGAQSTDISFSKATAAPPPKLGAIGGAVVRSKTVKRPSDTVGASKKGDQATVKVAEAYHDAMAEIVGQIVTEDDFVGAFLYLGDTESTFADHMQLDTFFRRQATRHMSRGNASLMQIARSAMDLMFGFVDGALKNWITEALKNDMSAVVGMIAVMERLSEQAEQEGTTLFLTQLFEKQLTRHRQAFDHFINDQIKTIDGAKNNMKRKRGVFYFVRHFPLFVDRLECQLVDADDLKIRGKVNDAYERVVTAVLDSLRYLSKIVAVETSSGDDKGQLYFHVVMIENLHVFVEEVSHLNVPALAAYEKRAQGLYKENLEAYIKLMMRRGFSRLMDFMDGVERLMKTTPANEVSLHNNYSKSTLKKVLKDTSAKDMRKAVEAMARRVDKHCTHDDDGGAVAGVVMNSPSPVDPATQALINSVWVELSNALKREITRAIDTIAMCYDNSLTLDYTVRDLESACQRAKATR